MDSPFTHLLTTNYVPSKDEVHQINKLLVGSVSQFDLLDAEILRLQKVIDGLSLKRAQLHSDIVGHRALTTPMRRIPEELLQEIFIRCLPVDHNALMSATQAPLLLGQVCSQWRSVSSSTPRLWSSLHIAVTEVPPPWIWGEPNARVEPVDDALHPEAVRMWLGRSGALPLSISLYYPSSPTSANGEKQMISSLTPFASRWRHIILLVSAAAFPLIASLSSAATPLLETFSLQNIATTIPSQIQPSCDIFKAPRLRVAKSSHPMMIPEGMEWSRLTSLSLESKGNGMEGLSPAMALKMLRECPNLIDCRLGFGWIHPDADSFNNLGIVTMPSLQTLSMKEAPINLKTFYDQLDLPGLVTLHLSVPSSISPEAFGIDQLPIRNLLPRLDILEELVFSAFNLSAHMLIDCLKIAPLSLTKLSILTPGYSFWSNSGWQEHGNMWHPCKDEVFTLLTPIEGQLPVCPRLKIIECNPGSVSDMVLLNFIQQRTTHAAAFDVQRLERVDIIFRRQMEIDILSQLPSHILAETKVELVYDKPVVCRTKNSPWGGLNKPGRLEMPMEPTTHHPYPL
jgi:hypothetical protein